MTTNELKETQKEWSAETLMAVGALFLGSFLVFIYLVSP
jgi:hypothetical protein